LTLTETSTVATLTLATVQATAALASAAATELSAPICATPALTTAAVPATAAMTTAAAKEIPAQEQKSPALEPNTINQPIEAAGTNEQKVDDCITNGLAKISFADKMAQRMDTQENEDMASALANIAGHTDLVQTIMKDFETIRSKKKQIKEIAQKEAAEQTAADGSKKTYAAAMQTAQDLRVVVYATKHTKQPLQMEHYQQISQHIVEKCSASLIAHFTLGEETPIINCSVHSLDPETRGLPITPTSQQSHKWLLREIDTLTLDGVKFRAWGLGEEPETFALQLYLNERYNSLQLEQIRLLLTNLNKELPETYTIEDYVEQQDRRANDKGRVFTVIGDSDFKNYCEQRNYQLAFAGGPISCITEAERLKRLAARNKPQTVINATVAAAATTSNSGSTRTSAYGKPAGSVPYRIPKKK
jgi:hypothetical protein